MSEGSEGMAEPHGKEVLKRLHEAHRAHHAVHNAAKETAAQIYAERQQQQPKPPGPKQ